MRRMLLSMVAALALVGEAAADDLTWGSVLTRTASGCDAFTPVRGPDGHHYTSFGDCNGLTGKLSPKLSMGFGRIKGGPATPTVEDLPTPELRDYGNREAGQKPSSAQLVGNRLYMWVRNYASGGKQARLKYSDDFTRASGSNWTWAPMILTQFGYPVFVQGAPGPYAYFIAHDNNSAYTPAGRFILMRVPSNQLSSRTTPDYYSGTAARPTWSTSYAARQPIFMAPGKCYRSGMSYNAARGRYYWWQNNGNSKETGSFEVWSGPNPWGPWTRIFFTSKWDINPGERGEFPVAWMGKEPISGPGTLHLLFSGSDRLKIRKATIAAGY
jgi:hypothetical protein